MRTILLASLAALGACASDPEPTAPPMPSARATNVADGSVPSTAAACLTRYSYPWLGLQINCPTEHVGGDPDHWVMTCAIPAGFGSQSLHDMPIPTLRRETTADAGQLLHEVIDMPPEVRLGYISGHDVSYVYDAQHRLAEIIQLDAGGTQLSHLVVGPRDPLGNPASIAIDGQPLAFNGVTYPATARRVYMYSYDDVGRLVTDEARFDDGVKFWDESISYHDRSLRRDRLVIVDIGTETHDGTGAGHNTSHELLDSAGHLLEVDGMVAGDPGPYVVGYRYDLHGRVSTQITTRSGFTAKIDYIYECP
jgi:hypothetical protein